MTKSLSGASKGLSNDAVSIIRPVAMSLALLFSAGVIYNLIKLSSLLFAIAGSNPEAANIDTNTRIVLPGHGDFEYDPVERFDFQENRPIAFAVVGGIMVVFAALLST